MTFEKITKYRLVPVGVLAFMRATSRCLSKTRKFSLGLLILASLVGEGGGLAY